MTQSIKSMWLTALSAVVAASLAGQPRLSAAEQAPGSAGEVSSKASAGVTPVGSMPCSADDSLKVLALGRQIYSDLQVARQATLNRQADRLRVALKEARANLAQLSLSPALQALKAQTAIVANNLADLTRPVDKDLWVPIGVELEKVSGYLASQTREQARAAARTGRIAAAGGDRRAAAAQLDLLTSFLQYEKNTLPLNHVQADVNSAWSSASLPQPYWKGALEAVQSALAEIRWMAGVNAGPLLAAYSDAVNAYVLWPQRKQAAIDYLGKSQQALGDLPDDAGLGAQAHRLMEKNDLGDQDLKRFVKEISRRIDTERVIERNKLLDQFSGTSAS